jgi:hypothetical protein
VSNDAVKALSNFQAPVWLKLGEGSFFTAGSGVLSGPILHVSPKGAGSVVEIDLTVYVEVSLEAAAMDPKDRSLTPLRSRVHISNRLLFICVSAVSSFLYGFSY